ncbi:MAG: hypothetical protein ACQEQ5_01880 [Thermodesulfobacteriota bacterium]
MSPLLMAVAAKDLEQSGTDRETTRSRRCPAKDEQMIKSIFMRI